MAGILDTLSAGLFRGPVTNSFSFDPLSTEPFLLDRCERGQHPMAEWSRCQTPCKPCLATPYCQHSNLCQGRSLWRSHPLHQVKLSSRILTWTQLWCARYSEDSQVNEDAFNSYCYITDTFSLPGAKGPHPGVGPHRDEVGGNAMVDLHSSSSWSLSTTPTTSGFLIFSLSSPSPSTCHTCSTNLHTTTGSPAWYRICRMSSRLMRIGWTRWEIFTYTLR